jgi:hypothetical protein
MPHVDFTPRHSTAVARVLFWVSCRAGPVLWTRQTINGTRVLRTQALTRTNCASARGRRTSRLCPIHRLSMCSPCASCCRARDPTLATWTRSERRSRWLSHPRSTTALGCCRSATPRDSSRRSADMSCSVAGSASALAWVSALVWEPLVPDWDSLRWRKRRPITPAPRSIEDPLASQTHS